MADDRATGWLLVLAQLALLAVIVVGPAGSEWQMPSWAGALANALEVAGLVVVVVGALQLGRGASVHPAPTSTATLHTGGVYRLARHPIYRFPEYGAYVRTTGRFAPHLRRRA